MSAKSATLAKSLHTVSVLVNIAAQRMESTPNLTAAQAVHMALVTLGYAAGSDVAADPHGLVAKAIALLGKQS
jgi:hypothetical protein